MSATIIRPGECPNCGLETDALLGHLLLCGRREKARAERAEAELETLRLHTTAKEQLLQDDLYRIARALDIPARPYSGHEAMDRDILPAIEALRRVAGAVREAQGNEIKPSEVTYHVGEPAPSISWTQWGKILDALAALDKAAKA